MSQALEHKESQLYGMCNEVRTYINTLIGELEIQPLEDRGEILTQIQLRAKLEDNHMKNKMKINQLEEWKMMHDQCS